MFCEIENPTVKSQIQVPPPPNICPLPTNLKFFPNISPPKNKASAEGSALNLSKRSRYVDSLDIKRYFDAFRLAFKQNEGDFSLKKDLVAYSIDNLFI